ncbi:MAG: M20/M25/M40 family metallo-hydrolase [Elusimicrobia bacterium]|nr:M20/M25/M40 family metallo-hydrolase [Elusimicrobiota bacterium]
MVYKKFLKVFFSVSLFFFTQPLPAFNPDFDRGVDIRSAVEESRKIESEFAYAEDERENPVWISVSDTDLAGLGNEFDFTSRQPLAHGNTVSVFKVKESELDELSDIMNRRFHKSAGFFAHTSFESALKDIIAPPAAMAGAFTIDRPDVVKPMLQMVSEENISDIITKLSAYKNRYYRSETGVSSARWLAGYWKELVKDRADVSVALHRHASWPQESVILTVKGSANPEQVAVLGGHFDSIAGWGSSDPVAPGADDNASGIAALTEAIRVMVKAGYKPKITLKFIAYAAEEVGLRGSREIADAFKKEGVAVQGVIQLDMANYKGSADDIYLIADHTNAAQNAFLGKLIETYTNYRWGETKCGYACSDHASWTANGFIASFPFEAKMGEDNPNIHSAKDTLAQTGGHSKHAFKFANLAVAYLVEMGK